MKNIDDLIPDIYQKINSQQTNWFTREISDDLASEVSKRLLTHYSPREGQPTLRLSQMGPKCPCALWHSIHHPELAEPLPANVMLKYSFGHIIEAQTIALAKAAGHEVTGEQDVLDVDGIKGHRDCVIDGCIVDVKSSSTRGMERFRTGSIAQDDPFGYLDQLDGYLVGSCNDPLVRTKDRGYILAIDKQLGHMVLYEHKLRADSILNRIQSYKQIVARSSPPSCECGTIPDGTSGNVKLDTKASYSSFKYCCFPNLRTFLYSKGPVYLTTVVKRPTHQGVPLVEVDKYGNVV